MKEPRWKNDDLLEFWSTRQDMYPKLYHVFSKLSCVPASSCASERAFSRAKYIISERRSSIGSENVNDLLILSSYLKDNSFSQQMIDLIDL